MSTPIGPGTTVPMAGPPAATAAGGTAATGGSTAAATAKSFDKWVGTRITDLQNNPASVMKKAPKPYILALLAAGIAGWMFLDAKAGINQQMSDNANRIKEQAEWNEMMYNKGRWPGYPAAGGIASALYRLGLRGPMDLKLQFMSFKENASLFFGRVIGGNAVPLGLAAIAAYIALGREFVNLQLLKGLRSVHSVLKPVMSWMPRTIGKGLKALVSPFGPKGKANAGLRWIFSSGKNFGIAAGAALFGWFVLNRVSESYGDESQREFFHDSIFSNKP